MQNMRKISQVNKDGVLLKVRGAAGQLWAYGIFGLVIGGMFIMMLTMATVGQVPWWALLFFTPFLAIGVYFWYLIIRTIIEMCRVMIYIKKDHIIVRQKDGWLPLYEADIDRVDQQAHATQVGVGGSGGSVGGSLPSSSGEIIITANKPFKFRISSLGKAYAMIQAISNGEDPIEALDIYNHRPYKKVETIVRGCGMIFISIVFAIFVGGAGFMVFSVLGMGNALSSPKLEATAIQIEAKGKYQFSVKYEDIDEINFVEKVFVYNMMRIPGNSSSTTNTTQGQVYEGKNIGATQEYFYIFNKNNASYIEIKTKAVNWYSFNLYTPEETQNFYNLILSKMSNETA